MIVITHVLCILVASCSSFILPFIIDLNTSVRELAEKTIGVDLIKSKVCELILTNFLTRGDMSHLLCRICRIST